MINGNLKASYGADERVLNNRNKQMFVYGCLLLLALFPLFADDYAILMACKMGILLIAVVGVNVLTGYTGLVSLGHGAFVAIGAYATVVLSNLFTALPEGVLPFVVVPCAVAISALVGIVVGLPSLRVKGLYLAVATLAASFIVNFLIEQELFAPGRVGSLGSTRLCPISWGGNLTRNARCMG